MWQVADYLGFTSFAMKDWIIVGSAAFAGFILILALNEYLEWKDFKYY